MNFSSPVEIRRGDIPAESRQLFLVIQSELILLPNSHFPLVVPKNTAVDPIKQCVSTCKVVFIVSEGLFRQKIQYLQHETFVFLRAPCLPEPAPVEEPPAPDPAPPGDPGGHAQDRGGPEDGEAGVAPEGAAGLLVVVVVGLLLGRVVVGGGGVGRRRLVRRRRGWIIISVGGGGPGGVDSDCGGGGHRGLTLLNVPPSLLGRRGSQRRPDKEGNSEKALEHRFIKKIISHKVFLSMSW